MFWQRNRLSETEILKVHAIQPLVHRNRLPRKSSMLDISNPRREVFNDYRATEKIKFSIKLSDILFGLNVLSLKITKPKH